MCPVCGGDVPPSLGCKPRKYCSPACRQSSCKGIHGRNQKPHFCVECGTQVPYSGRGPRRGLKCHQCKRAAEKQRLSKAAKPRQCLRCGQSFRSPYRKKFCSHRCQHGGVGKKHGDIVPCKTCGLGFRRSRPGQVYCSRRCAQPPGVYTCLNCGAEFRKRRYKSGSVSCQKKYCSRDCAFEARRLKKSCAQRPLEVAGKLAKWFLSWGDDQWPATSHCRACGDQFCAQRRASDEKHEKCMSCRNKESKTDRPCPGCGCVLPRRRRWCANCSARRSKDQRRKNKRARRKKHGNDCTFRKRCKKYGVPYTKVSRQAVMERDGWRCQLCSVKLLASFTTIVGTKTPHPRSPTIDHIVPLSFGPGSPGHVFDNCQAACWACNCERGAEDADSFARRKATG